MVRRIITGLLIGIAWIAALCFMPGWLLCVILCVMSCLCQAEFYGMLRKGVTRLPSSPLWGMALGCIWLVYTYLFPPDAYGRLAELRRLCFVELEEHLEDGAHVTARLPQERVHRRPWSRSGSPHHPPSQHHAHCATTSLIRAIPAQTSTS